MHSKHILRPLIGTVLLLLIPLIAMQFTSEVQWDAFDFVFMGVLLFGAGLTYELASNRGGTTAYRFAVGLGVFTSLFPIWVNGAVGIIGSEDNPANLLYAGVLLTGFIGAIAARLQAHGMSYTMFAMAIVRMAVPAIAFIMWRPGFDIGVVQIFVLNAIFAAFFVGSGLLFQQSAEIHA